MVFNRFLAPTAEEEKKPAVGIVAAAFCGGQASGHFTQTVIQVYL
jgi:hypothetical protein